MSESVLSALRVPPRPVLLPDLDDVDLLTDDDAQLALACCYELHYESFAGVDDGWEWEPGLLAARRRIESRFVARLVEQVGPPRPVSPHEVIPALRAIAAGDGPSLSASVERAGTIEHLRELCVHRSAYQLKEADPHTWTIPRLRGRAKAAMVTIQHDEYGEGRPEGMHAELFADTLRELDLDPTYGAYLPRLPGTTLATVNLVSMLGLHRRWRAASVGHLALFEMTSVGPMSRYAGALRRLGFGSAATRFYDVHVAADAVHEVVAQQDLVAGLLEAAPHAGADVLFGARALTAVEARFATAVLDAWAAGRSSLLAPLPAPQCGTSPPSTSSTCPVMKLDASDAR